MAKVYEPWSAVPGVTVKIFVVASKFMKLGKLDVPYRTTETLSMHAAFKTGYNGDTIDRVGCQQVADESGSKLPRWLMKDPLRRVARGVYAVPELQLFAAQQKEVV